MTSKDTVKEHLNKLRKQYAPSPRTIMMTGAFLGATFCTTAVQAKINDGKIVVATNARHTDHDSKYYLQMTKAMTLQQIKEKIYGDHAFAYSNGSIKNTLILDGEDRNIGVICADDAGQVLGAFIDIQAYNELTGKDMGKMLRDLGFEPSSRRDIEGYVAVATAIRTGNMNSSNFNVDSLQDITETLHKKGYEFKLSEDLNDGTKSLKIFKKDQLIGLMGNYYKNKVQMWLRTDDVDLQQMMDGFRANGRNDFSKLYQQLQQDSDSQTYQIKPTQKQY